MFGGARRLAQEAAVELSLKKLDSLARVLYFLIDTLREPPPGIRHSIGDYHTKIGYMAQNRGA